MSPAAREYAAAGAKRCAVYAKQYAADARQEGWK